jgi:hypothetical protein
MNNNGSDGCGESAASLLGGIAPKGETLATATLPPSAANGKTIGGCGFDATERANKDAEALFAYIWASKTI